MPHKSTPICSQVTHNDYQSGVPGYTNFPTFCHLLILTNLSAAVLVYYILDTRLLCFDIDTLPTEYVNKSIANDCVIPCHCKHFHSQIFSNRFIFSVSTLSRAAKPHEAWNKIYVLTRHFITLISYYKLLINHFPL